MISSTGGSRPHPLSSDEADYGKIRSAPSSNVRYISRLCTVSYKAEAGHG